VPANGVDARPIRTAERDRPQLAELDLLTGGLHHVVAGVGRDAQARSLGEEACHRLDSLGGTLVGLALRVHRRSDEDEHESARDTRYTTPPARRGHSRSE